MERCSLQTPGLQAACTRSGHLQGGTVSCPASRHWEKAHVRWLRRRRQNTFLRPWPCCRAHLGRQGHRTLLGPGAGGHALNPALHWGAPPKQTPKRRPELLRNRPSKEWLTLSREHTLPTTPLLQRFPGGSAVRGDPHPHPPATPRLCVCWDVPASTGIVF